MTPWEIFDNFGAIGLLILSVIYFKTQLHDVRTKLKKCDDDREALHVRAEVLEAHLRFLEKKIAGEAP